MGKLILFIVVCVVVSLFLGPVGGAITFLGGLLMAGIVAIAK
jgi:hypothetical protein